MQIGFGWGKGRRVIKTTIAGAGLREALARQQRWFVKQSGQIDELLISEAQAAARLKPSRVLRRYFTKGYRLEANPTDLLQRATRPRSTHAVDPHAQPSGNPSPRVEASSSSPYRMAKASLRPRG